jgi:sugar phosphate isomerase/epimerase
MATTSPPLDRLCLHTVTTRPWEIETALPRYAEAGVAGVSLWRDAVAGRDLLAVRRQLADLGLTGVSLVRGGQFAQREAGEREAALEENRRCIEEAHALGLPVIVLVCGADPRQPLETSRKQIAEALSALADEAAAAGVTLGIEPLHPMYAGDRSAVNMLRQANDMAEEIDHRAVSIVVDAYHLWWDPDLETQIRRCARLGKLAALHISDWRIPTQDTLLDREIMGRGCIPLGQIIGWAQDAGYTGFLEVEIFSRRYWEEDQASFLEWIVEGYKKINIGRR